MPFFQPGDWIKHRGSKTRYRVLYVHADGQIIAEDPDGQMHILTRPEMYYKTTAPEGRKTTGRSSAL
jgi:hypothetical protein